MALNEALLGFQRSSISQGDVLARLDDLFTLLQRLPRPATLLDGRLADYVFFPISQVFRERARLPLIAYETALGCLKVLFQTGWRSIEDAEVAVQLLILLTFAADVKGHQGQSSSRTNLQTSDGVRATALVCMQELFLSLEHSHKCKANLLDSNIAAIGHAVTVILDCLKNDQTPQLQITAAGTLRNFISYVSTASTVKNFMPGIVSVLSYILAPNTSPRRPFQLLQTSLQLLQKVISISLAEPETSLLKNVSTPGRSSTAVDPSWLSTTATQMKVALAHVLRLRDHKRVEVRDSLMSLCWLVVRECNVSLAESCPMAFDTLIYINSSDTTDQAFHELLGLLQDVPAMVDTLKSQFYDLVLSIPRIMQSNDDARRKLLTRKVVLMHRLLSELDSDTTIMDDLLAQNLVEGLVDEFHERFSAGTLAPAPSDAPSRIALITSQDTETAQGFSSILADNTKQYEMLDDIRIMSSQISTSKTALPLASRLLDAARSNRHDVQTISFWLCLSILKSFLRDRQQLDYFLDLTSLTTNEDSLFQDLYDFSLSLLANVQDDEKTRQRLQALALEGIALNASWLGRAFRTELVDALYPVVELIGASSITLRNRAQACLGLVASSCGYESTQSLLMSNVDYLVNAISLKLSTFDISPQGPQILLIMTRLCGPVLLPYIDDLMESIFDALDCFHGYPKLVAVLFSVLEGIIDESVKLPQGNGLPTKPSFSRRLRQPVAMERTVETIKTRYEKRRGLRHNDTGTMSSNLPTEAPRRPWGELSPKTTSPSHDPAGETPMVRKDTSRSVIHNDAINLKISSKTYSMIHRIASSMQHHLPSASISTRASALSILDRALPYLSGNEDNFLPLINTLWPALVPRLSDTEPFIVASVFDVMASMCAGSADFMSTRIEALWPTVERIWRENDAAIQAQSGALSQPSQGINLGIKVNLDQIERDSLETLGADILNPFEETMTIAPIKSNADLQASQVKAMAPYRDRYVSTVALTIRAAVDRFLVEILSHVPVSQSIYHRMLNRMLYHQLIRENSEKVEEALTNINPDAVWLILERSRWKDDMGGDRCMLWQQRKPMDEKGSPIFAEVSIE